MNPSEQSLWKNMSVSRKIALLPAFFIAAILLTILFTVLTVSSQRRDAVVIEINGRQRMLNERHFKEVLLVAFDGQDPAELEVTRKFLNESQKALIDGGKVPARLNGNGEMELPPAPTSEIRKILENQQKSMGEFQQMADTFLRERQSGDATSGKTLEALVRKNLEIEEYGVDATKALTSHTLSRSEQLIISEIIIGSVVALAGLLFSWLITRGVIPPLQQLVGASKRISEGDLRGSDVPVTSADEIGRMTHTFNRMLTNLKELNGQIRSVATNINSASAEILASTQQQAASTKEQAATVQEITATMQQISQSGVDISEKAKVVAASAEATSTASRSGFEAVRNTTRLMDGIRHQVDEVAEKIVALSEKTQAVGEIISTVNEIAEQSNLLALNAAIEAASAGEQGSRFSVVAGEMKSLADRAKQSTIQVRTILGDIQKGINSCVMFTEEAVKRSELGKEQAQLTEKTINQMTDTTIESVHAFQQIIGAMGQQQIGLEQVTQGVRDIKLAAEQTATGASQLEGALANLNELSLELRSTVNKYQI